MKIKYFLSSWACSCKIDRWLRAPTELIVAHFPKFISNQTKVASKEDVLKLFFNSATLKLLKEFIKYPFRVTLS